MKTCKNCGHKRVQHSWNEFKSFEECQQEKCPCKKFEPVKITTNYDKDNIKYLKLKKEVEK